MFLFLFIIVVICLLSTLGGSEGKDDSVGGIATICTSIDPVSTDYIEDDEIVMADTLDMGGDFTSSGDMFSDCFSSNDDMFS